MDNASSTDAPWSDDGSDEIPIPSRSPSRLDFCMENVEDGGSILDIGEDLAAGWASFRDDRPYASIEEEALEVDGPPLDRHTFPIVEDKGDGDDPPQLTDSHAHEDTATPLSPPAHPTHSMDQVIPEPLAPTPVRLRPVQFQINVQEPIPFSRVVPQRLNYPHHGFSRSALLQQKILWGARHEEWAEWQSRMHRCEVQESHTDDPYTGLAASQSYVTESPPSIRPPPSGLERDLVDYPPNKHEQNVNASIYPRVGDISALRDPYAVNVDRSFFRYPLWTLHKALYVFDMQQRSTSPTLPAFTHNQTVTISMSSSTLSSYASSSSGDDQESDSTLVADDAPASPIQSSHVSLKCPSPCSPPSWNHFVGWRASWYTKWELLTDIFQHDRLQCDVSMKLEGQPESTLAPQSPARPIFPFAADKDEDNRNHDDDDDEEDYGTILSHFNFRADFEEECERAMAFYSRERATL